MSEQVLKATNQLIEIITNDYNKQYSFSHFEFTEGNKFYKIIKVDNQRSVHAFVDKITGDLFKPSGWNAPAKGARFNLLKDMELLKARADWAGGYLYR